MNDLDVYLDREISRTRGVLLATAIVCTVLVGLVVIGARKAVDNASVRLSSASIVDQVGRIADREVTSRESDIDEHLRTWIPQMLAGGAQSAIDGVDRYRLKLEDRIASLLGPVDDAGIDVMVDHYLSPAKNDVGPELDFHFDEAGKARLDAIFTPISMTRDRLRRLAANGSDLLPFDRLTRRSIAVLLKK